MHTKLLRLLLLLVLAANAGCALRPLDAPWDPPAGRSLHEQLPAWQSKAAIHCAGHLKPQDRKSHQTNRC
jgi:hypothetical protein